MKFNSIVPKILAGTVFLLLTEGCMKWDYGDGQQELEAKGDGLFILCEGNFQYGNSTLWYYDPEDRTVTGEAFLKANGMKLGDVAQSMTMYGDKGWIVVNNSHVIFAINPDTFREIGRIENLTSPRLILFVNDDKAYVTQLWDNRIFIVNPRTYSIIGHIEVPGMTMESASTEEMVRIGKYVYCTCWSYQNRIIRIDTDTDEVVGQLEIGIQPKSLVADSAGKLWTITDGGYTGSPYGSETPALYRIDPSNFSVEKVFKLKDGTSPRALTVNGCCDTIYWICDDVWKMAIESERLPVQPFLESKETKYYSLAVDPRNGDVYVGDAIDYQQQGLIYRYSPQGELTDEFYVGVTPGAFCWK